jgi:hypothetical protein
MLYMLHTMDSVQRSINIIPGVEVFLGLESSLPV